MQYEYLDEKSMWVIIEQRLRDLEALHFRALLDNDTKEQTRLEGQIDGLRQRREKYKNRIERMAGTRERKGQRPN